MARSLFGGPHWSAKIASGPRRDSISRRDVIVRLGNRDYLASTRELRASAGCLDLCRNLCNASDRALVSLAPRVAQLPVRRSIVWGATYGVNSNHR